MPITFSSFGDIVAVLQLAWQLRAALSEATGASAEIRELIIDIDSFMRTLQHIKASITKRRTPLEPSVEHGIKHALIACHAVLRAILSRLAAFQTRMTSKVGAAAWRQYWAVTAWSILGGKKEVDGLRTRLSEQLGVIQTYLALSQANDQSAVLEAVEHQVTTIERVYSVVQDIQLRFDVGVPTFQFYDEHKKRYYQPCARTSLTRFMHLLGMCFNSATISCQTSDPDIIQQTLQKTQTQCVMNHSLLHRFEPPEFWAIQVDCCYYRERAFDQWQVLIGMPHVPHDTVRVLKHLVERKHAFNTTCNCDGARCRVLLRGVIQRAQYIRDMHRTVSLLDHMTALGWVMKEDAARRHYEMCENIFAELERNPDGNYLRQTIIPLLKLHIEHQRPSGACIVRLLRNSPRSLSPLDDLIAYCTVSLETFEFVPWDPSVFNPPWLSASLSTAPRRPHFEAFTDTASWFLCYV